jgi:hypothetical protein
LGEATHSEGCTECSICVNGEWRVWPFIQQVRREFETDSRRKPDDMDSSYYTPCNT